MAAQGYRKCKCGDCGLVQQIHTEGCADNASNLRCGRCNSTNVATTSIEKRHRRRQETGDEIDEDLIFS